MPIRELPFPPKASRTDDADEILRVLINSDKTMDLVMVRGFNDAATWGTLLADVAYHIARSYTAMGDNETQAYARIRQAFLEETGKRTGGTSF